MADQMNGYQIGAVISASLTSWYFVMNVERLPIEERLTAIRTFSLLFTDNPLSGFGMVFYLL